MKETALAITRSTPLGELPQFLSVDEAAVVMNVSKGLIYTMAQSGQLGSCRFGRLLRIPREAIESMRAGQNGNGRHA